MSQNESDWERKLLDLVDNKEAGYMDFSELIQETLSNREKEIAEEVAGSVYAAFTPPKPTACCEKCYEVLQTETTSTNSNSIVKGQQVQCSNTFCPCHQPASKECDCDSPICVNRDHKAHKINFKELLKAAEAIKKYHHPGTEEESQAPHETPTKTCTCPHCDNWRCDHGKRV